MGKNILGVILGVIGGSALVFMIEKLSHVLYPPPTNLNFNDKEALAEHMSNIPLSALAIVMLAHTLGALVASVIGAKVAKSRKFYMGILAGFVLLVSTITVLMIIPHPIWFMALDLILVVTAIFFGAKLASRGEIIIEH